MIDLANNDEVVAMFVYTAGEKYLIASDKGYGFIVDENHILAQTRNGRKIMNVADNENMKFCLPVCGDYVAIFIRSIIGIDRQLAIAKFNELISAASLNSQQEEYLKTIINYVCENGDISRETITNVAPFDGFD
jgi:DNA gyrase/topoisomerase IV subunit A